MKEYWTDKMRRKLAGHRKEPPAGLWDGICEQMGMEPDLAVTPEPVRKPTVLRRWSWAAAAAVLALAGFFVFYDNNSGNQPQQTETVSQQTTLPQPDKTLPIGESPLGEASVVAVNQTDYTDLTQKQTKSRHQNISSQEDDTSILSASDDKKVTSPVSSDKKDAISVSDEETTVLPASDNKQVAEQTPSETQKQQQQGIGQQLAEETGDKSVQKNESEQMGDHQPKRQDSGALLPSAGNNWVARQSSDPSTTKWSIGVNASGGLLAAHTTSLRTERVYYDFNGIDITNSEVSYDSYTLTDYVSKHYLPIRFGVSMDYRLSPRLTLLSGVSYTYQHSQFSLPLYPETTVDQKLHYLGIPLGLAWQLWSSQHFQLYVSGGVTVEKCLNDKPWQWSTHAAAGAEYTIFRQLGFYVEPSLGYYFDDGTSLEHYYKKLPLAPSLEFGLRMHLNR